MRELLKLSDILRSTFYYRLSNLGKENKYKKIKEKITSIFCKHEGRYGYKRITQELRNRGYVINHKTFAKLMNMSGGPKDDIVHIKTL